MPDKLTQFQSRKKPSLYTHHQTQPVRRAPLTLTLTLLLIATTTLTLTSCGRKPVEITPPQNQKQFSYPPADPKWTDGSLPEDAEKQLPKAPPLTNSDEFTR